MPRHKKDIKGDFQQLIARLENLILIGAFQPRERLVENDLAQKLGVSRSWIRDALKILETKGLVKMIPYKGAMVRDLTAQEINEIFAVRVVLESLVYRLACDNVQATDIEHLKNEAAQIRTNYEGNNFEAMIQANARFHEYITQLSGNRTLIEMLNQLKIRFHIFNTFAWSSPEIVSQLLLEHDRIIQGLEQKDVILLDDLGRKHISHSKDLYLVQLKTRQFRLSN